jgi:hypothetical protein
LKCGSGIFILMCMTKSKRSTDHYKKKLINLNNLAFESQRYIIKKDDSLNKES